MAEADSTLLGVLWTQMCPYSDATEQIKCKIHEFMWTINVFNECNTLQIYLFNLRCILKCIYKYIKHIPNWNSFFFFFQTSFSHTVFSANRQCELFICIYCIRLYKAMYTPSKLLTIVAFNRLNFWKSFLRNHSLQVQKFE